MSVAALAVIAVAILVLVALAKRIGVAYPIVLVLGGIVLGYIPGVPRAELRPDLVFLVFLPPLLYWESVTAPTSGFKAGAAWIFQLAFGLVIATTVAVAFVAHKVDPAMGWPAALVLGAIVSSTDEVAFASIADKLRVPRHLIATIEGESLINDATSLIIYAVAIGAVLGQVFTIGQAFEQLVISVVAAIAIGLIAGGLIVTAWHFTRDDELQPIISLMAPYLAYLPAYHFKVSGVLAVVVTGIFVSRFTPRVLTPRARQRATGFWVTIVFVVNAFIFVLVGMQFHPILTESLSRYSAAHLVWLALAICATVIIVRLLWVFGQALIPFTNEPEHERGKADWAHVSVLAWTGMRGGISLAAALALPLMIGAGRFPQRSLIIFLTFAVLLATLVGQGGTLPWLLRLLRIREDDQAEREERLALSRIARVALIRLAALRKERNVPPPILVALQRHHRSRWREFADAKEGEEYRNRVTSQYRAIERELLGVQREELIRLRDRGKIDNTVMRRITALLDLEDEEVSLLSATGHTDIDPEK
jgi:CPA1 family monovalent cation:H+ antiporter